MALVHCRECGEMISDSAPTCPKCGARQNLKTNGDFIDGFKGGSVGLKVLSVLIPVAGLILFLEKKDSEPVAAKAYGLWALLGVVISLFLFML